MTARRLIIPAMCLALLSCSSSPQRNAPHPKNFISKVQFGDKWPLTVDSATLNCTILNPKGYTGPKLTAVTLEANGSAYAVNGIAISHRLGKDIAPIVATGAPIWVTDPQTNEKVNVGPPKMDISPILNAGLKLCEDKN